LEEGEKVPYEAHFDRKLIKTINLINPPQDTTQFEHEVKSYSLYYNCYQHIKINCQNFIFPLVLDIRV